VKSYSKDTNKILTYGNNLSIYISRNVSGDLLKWLNDLEETGPTILDILEKYVAGGFIDLEKAGRYLPDLDDVRTDPLGDMENELYQAYEDELEPVPVVEDWSVVYPGLKIEQEQEDFPEDPDDIVIEEDNPFI